MNVGWSHLDAAPDAFAGVGEPLPPFADRAGVGALLGCPPPDVGVENVWFIPRKSLRVVYRAGDATAVVTWGDPPAVRAMVDDPALPALAGLLDPGEASRRAGGEVTRIGVLSYLPGKRCAVRWRGPEVDVVAKTADDEDMAAGEARQRALFDLPGRTFAMAEPLGADGPVRMERAVPGERAEALVEAVPAGRLMSAVAAALPGLGAVPAEGLPRLGTAEVLSRMTGKTVGRVGDALPSLRERLCRVLDLLAAAEPPPRPPSVIHGDLHTANVLFSGDLTPAFVDLDTLALGDPEHDLALFASRMTLLGMVGGIPVAPPPGYGGPDQERYRWYVAATLVGRQMKTCVRHLAPGVLPLCEGLLARAETLLSG